MKILLIDDNRQSRQMIKDYVLTESDIFLECEDGSEALSAYTKFQPDWVLMDWDMKNVNGIFATRNIISQFPEAKILMVSNYDEIELKQMAKQAGACGYIQKDNLLELKQILTNQTALG